MRALRVAILVPCLGCLPLQPVRAADAHIGVHPAKGEMVLLRDVNARPAYRPAPPGIALIVDPKPNREIALMLGAGEMSDDEFASMSTGRVGVDGVQATLPEQIVGRAMQGSIGGMTGSHGGFGGDGVARAVGGVTGTLGGATRSIAPTITGALSQFPVGAQQGKGP